MGVRSQKSISQDFDSKSPNSLPAAGRQTKLLRTYDLWQRHRHRQYRTDRATHETLGRPLSEPGLYGGRNLPVPTKVPSLRMFRHPVRRQGSVSKGYWLRASKWNPMDGYRGGERSLGKTTSLPPSKGKGGSSNLSDRENLSHPFPRPTIRRGACPIRGERR